MTDIPTVYVELIEEQPLAFGPWAEDHPGVDFRRDGGFHGLTGGQQQLIEAAYRDYLQRFQPFRWNAKGGNHEIVGQGERYFNRADAEHAIRLQYGQESSVYLVRDGEADELLRQAYPHTGLNGTTVIGPECFASADGDLIQWKGSAYGRYPDEYTPSSAFHVVVGGDNPAMDATVTAAADTEYVEYPLLRVREILERHQV